MFCSMGDKGHNSRIPESGVGEIHRFDFITLLMVQQRTSAVYCGCKATNQTNEPRHEKTTILVSDLTRHKPGCAATEDG